MEQVKILLMTAIGIFAVLDVSSIAVVHASIPGDFGMGYQAGKNQAYIDFPAGTNNDACPGGSISYCSGYVSGYDLEGATLQQAQP
jgi:hypothetical protein